MDNISKVIEAIGIKLSAVECRLNVSMKDYTSIKIGGVCRAMCFPQSTGELTALCELLRECATEYLIIGNGTNLIIDDRKPLEMIAVKTTKIDDISLVGGNEIKAGAGVALSKLSEYACKCGLAGLEFAHGIPGTLGGAVSINAGAYGSEMKDVVISTTAYSHESGEYEITGDEHGFSYRRSRFTDTPDIALSSVLKLKKDDSENIRHRMEELSNRRRENQPLDKPSAGSTFKRPKEGYAASLIEQAGLKGYISGGAQISPKHAGFIVNNGGATFADVMAIIDHVKITVFEQFGVDLEQENKIIWK